MVHTATSTTVATAIFVLKTGILLFGGLITYFSFKAYRRTGSPALRSLGVGFGIITFGAALAGAFDVILHVDLATGVLIDAALTFLGFGFITYALYVE
ncbi:MAG: hypothetical protein ABEJ28_12870 [Salinigranum sp.]